MLFGLIVLSVSLPLRLLYAFRARGPAPQRSDPGPHLG